MLAEVYRSTLDNVRPGTTLTIKPPTPLARLPQSRAIYFEALQPIVEDAPAMPAAVIVPLRADDETYGILLLHDVVPAHIQPLIDDVAEQFGLALSRVQFLEELRRRHSIDAAKLGAVAETSKVLRELDLDAVLAKLMELALSAVAAEVGCIVLRQAEDTTLTCRIEWGLDGVAVQQLQFQDGETLVERVLREKIPLMFSHLRQESPFVPVPLLDGIHSIVALPLVTHTRVLGGLVLVNLGVSSPQDMELLQTIVELSSTAIENALLHQEALEKAALREQLRIAGNIQRALLPKATPALKGVRMSAWSKPCDESGGDYYDVFPFDEHRLGFVVGDATGHGIGAALIATTVRALLRALVPSSDDLGQLFERLNNLAATDFPEGKFVTLFYGVYDTRDRILTYVNAGHRPPLILYRQQHETFEHLTATGIPLGIFTGVPYAQQATAPLEAGDVVLLLTDGVEEAVSETGEWFGKERLLDLIRTHRTADAPDLIQTIYQEVKAFCGAAPQKDDITLLCMRVTAD
jgi:sigma-B regulation protein RsbU (phosphoserine phosphatase)